MHTSLKSFPPHGYGLYDISGNVWEIVAVRFHPQTYQMRAGKVIEYPQRPGAQFLAQTGRRMPICVTRGRSFLCSDSWCRGYQPGSRQSFEMDSPANHTGFRWAKDTIDEPE